MPEATKVTLILEPAVWAFLDGSRSKVKQSRSEYIAGLLTEMYSIAQEDAAKQTADQEAILAQEEQLAICAAATAHLESLETALRTLYHAAEVVRGTPGGHEDWELLCDALAVAEKALGIEWENPGDKPEVEKTQAIVGDAGLAGFTSDFAESEDLARAKTAMENILGEELTEEDPPESHSPESDPRGSKE